MGAPYTQQGQVRRVVPVVHIVAVPPSAWWSSRGGAYHEAGCDTQGHVCASHVRSPCDVTPLPATTPALISYPTTRNAGPSRFMRTPFLRCSAAHWPAWPSCPTSSATRDSSCSCSNRPPSNHHHPATTTHKNSLSKDPRRPLPLPPAGTLQQHLLLLLLLLQRRLARLQLQLQRLQRLPFRWLRR